MAGYLLSFLILSAATVPVVVVCRRLARALLAGSWERWAATLFLVSLQIVLSMQLLGALGAWRPVPYLLVAWVGSVAVELFARRIAAAEPETAGDGSVDGGSGLPRWVRVVAVAGPVVLVTAAVVNVLFAPDTANDSTLYHRAMVAAWHRTNTIWRLGAFENGTYEGAYWSNGDVFGMWVTIPFRRDYLLQLCSLVWAAGTFTALVAAARSLGLATWNAVLTASAVSCAWGVAYGQLSTFHVDLLNMQAGAVLVWWGLTWLRGDRRLRWAVLAGLAAGLAAGTKQAALPFAALCVVVLVAVALRNRRFGHAAAFALFALVPAAIWPVRNWVVAGNPLWPIALGPFAGATPGYTTLDPDMSVADLVLRDGGEALGTVVSAFLVAYGPLLVGVLLGVRRIWRWGRRERVAWFALGVPVLAIAAYLVTPLTGFAPFQVFVTMRFVAPPVAMLTLALGAACLPPDVETVRRWRLLFAVAVVYGTVTVAGSHLYPSIFQWPPWSWLLALVAGAGAAIFLTSGRARRVPPRTATIVAAVAAGLLVVVAVPARAANWYPFHVGFEDERPVAEWFEANEPSGANVAFVGVLSGWLHGRDLSNDVYYLGKPAENHGVTHWDDRDAWEEALLDACTDYLVVGNNDVKWGRPLPEFGWADESDILTRVELGPPPAGARYEVQLYEVAHDPGRDCRPPN